MPTRDPATLARDLAQAWLGPGVTLEPLQAMNSSTWEVHGAAERLVLKVARASDLPGLEVARWLGSRGFRAGAPRRLAVDGGLVAALLEFVEGRPLQEGDAVLIGRTLGSAHRLLARAPVPDALDRWPWRFLDASLVREPALRRAAQGAVDSAHELAQGLTHGVLHGDPAPEAFREHDGVVGLIDWGAALHGPLLYDVASARMYAGPEVLAGYAETGPLGDDELSHVPTFLAFRWAVQAWYFSWRIAEDDLTGLDSRADNEKGLADARRFLVRDG